MIFFFHNQRLYLPPFKGAQTIYAKVLRPFLLTYQSDVDKNLNKLKTKVNEATKEAIQKTVENAAASKPDFSKDE